MGLTCRERTPHVLVLAYHFPPYESAGFSVRTVKWIKYLAREGWRFTVITTDPERPVVPAECDTSRFLLAELPHTVRIVRVASLISLPNITTLVRIRRRVASQASWRVRLKGGMTRCVNALRLKDLFIPDLYMLWALSALAEAIRTGRHQSVDIVFATSPPYSTSWLGSRVARSLALPLVLDFRDDWIDTPFYSRQWKWLQWLHKFLERKVIRTADRVISVTEVSHENFLERHPADKDKFHVIPNGCDLEDFEALPAHKPGRFFTIFGAGDHRRATRDPAPFYKAVGRLAARRADVRQLLRVRLIGGTLRREFSNNELESWGASGLIEECAPLPKEDFLSGIVDADLLLVILTHGWTRMVPGKLYEYWAAGGAPILLLDDGGPARELLSKFQLGMAVDRGNVDAIERAIESCFDAWKGGKPVRISSHGIEQFDRRRLAMQLGAVVHEALTDAIVRDPAG